MTFYAVSLQNIETANISGSALKIAHASGDALPAIDGVYFLPIHFSEWYIALVTGVVDMVVTSSRDTADYLADLLLGTYPEGTWTYELENGGAIADITDVDNEVLGTPGDDSLDGTALADVMFSYGGNDVMNGFGGNDVIRAGTGDDTVIGGGGDDTLYGGAGRDRLVGKLGNDEIFGGDHRDVIFGNAGADALDGGRGNDVINGGAGNDTVFGRGGHDKIFGGPGYDILRGNTGNDVLNAGAGGGTMFGGAGNDRLDWTKGTVLLLGGAGADTFVFRANGGQSGTVNDFVRGEDVIDMQLSGVTSIDDLNIIYSDGRSLINVDGHQSLIVWSDGILTPDDFLFADPA